MRILYITRVSPYPPTSGALSYSAKVIADLAATAELDVVCNAPPDGVLPPANEAACAWHITRLPRFNRASALASPLPGEVYRYKSNEFLQAIGELLAKKSFDITFVDHIGSASALPLLTRSNNSGKIVYLSHNHETTVRREVARFSTRDPLKILYGRVDAKKVAISERHLVRSSHMVTAISSDDVELFKLDGAAEVELLSPVFDGDKCPSRTITAELPRTALVLGSLEWHAKSESLIRFLRYAKGPLTAAGITLEIVGRASPRAKHAIQNSGSWVKHYDYVDDLRPHLGRARLGLMIDQVGGGFKTKLLDYFFSRVPVIGVASQLNGLSDFVIGTHFIGGNTVADVTDAIVDKIDDLSALNDIQERAYSVASRVFGIETRERQLRSILKSR